MKTRHHIFAILILLGGPFFAYAGSKTFGWNVRQQSENPIVTKTYLAGPMMQNKVPEKRGAFKGHFFVSNTVQADLVRIHKVRIGEKGEILTSEVGFTVLSRTSVKNTKLTQVKLQTDVIEFEHGDALILIFKIEGRMDMVYTRIVQTFSTN